MGAAAGEEDELAPGVAPVLPPLAELPLATGFIAVVLVPDDPPQAAVNSVAAAATAVSWTARRHAGLPEKRRAAPKAAPVEPPGPF
jgi:hypothetical protein